MAAELRGGAAAGAFAAGQDIDMDDSGSPAVQRPLQAPAALLALDNPGADALQPVISAVGTQAAHCDVPEAGRKSSCRGREWPRT